MILRKTPVLDSARVFRVNEMFFSTTNPKGVILAGNEVFTRISGYSEAELIGAPHNVIRHPAMPRAAFRQLWSSVQGGQPFCGYVKNLAKDGAYYWVFAFIVPLRDGRLLSIRFKPTSPLLATVEPVYARILEAENAAVAAGQSEPAAVDAGVAALGREIAALGYASYEQFAEAAFGAEIKSRDAALLNEGLQLFPADLGNACTDEAAHRAYREGRALYIEANELFAALDRISELSTQLQSEAVSVIGVAEEFQLSALNTNITSTRFGAQGAAISVIAGFLTGYALTMNEETGVVRRQLAQLAEATRGINAHVAAARLQLEMMLCFQAELAARADERGAKLLPDLVEAFAASTAAANRDLQNLAASITPVAASRDILARAVTSIHMAQVRGLTEAARLEEAGGLRTMFEEFRARTEKARGEISRISDVLEDFQSLLEPLPGRLNVMRGAA